MGKLITGIIGVGLAILSALLMWKCVLGFLLSLIPPDAAYSWIGKLICVFAVGYFGGIAIPLVILVLTVYFILQMYVNGM